MLMVSDVVVRALVYRVVTPAGENGLVIPADWAARLTKARIAASPRWHKSLGWS
jgi:hypothetical protein